MWLSVESVLSHVGHVFLRDGDCNCTGGRCKIIQVRNMLYNIRSPTQCIVTIIYFKWEKISKSGICFESDNRWQYYSELMLPMQIP